MADNATSWFNDLPQVPGTKAPPQMGGGGGGIPANVPIQPQATPSDNKDWWSQLAPVSQQPKAPVAAPTTMTPANNMDWIYENPREKAAARQAAPQPTTPANQPAGSWGNLAGAVPTGLYKGLAQAANLPTYAVNGVSDLINGVGGTQLGHLKAPFEEVPGGYKPIGSLAENIQNAGAALTNTLALGAAGKAFAPVFATGSAPQIVSQAIGNTPPAVAAASAIGGGIQEPIAERVPPEWRGLARIGANIGAGGLISGVETAAGNALRTSAEPGVAQLAQLGRDTYNIPIRAGQITSNRTVRALDSVLQSVPFSGHAGVDEAAQLALNRAVANEMGETASKITPSVMNAARTRIGGVLQNVEQHNVVNFDSPLVERLAQIESDAQSSLTDQEYGVIKRQLSGVMSNVQPGDQIAGTTYGNLMHKGAPLDAAANSGNPNIAKYASDTKEALRDSLQRSLSSDDLAAYQQARSQWKVMRTIEPLTVRADIVGGASPATGDIIPAQLRGVVSRSYGNSAFAEPGQVPLNDLANIGQRFLKETPTSQTSERSAVRDTFKHIAGGAAALAGEHALGLPPMSVAAPLAAGAGVALGAARLSSSILRSDALANKMITQGLNPAAREAPLVAAGQASIPIGVSATSRQLEAPQPSVNPATGLQQFNPEDALAENRMRAAKTVVEKVQQGATPSELSAWIGENKRGLRAQFGGQGIQNISMVASMMRRPGTLFSQVMGSADPALRRSLSDAGIEDMMTLAQHAIMHPAFADALKQPTTRDGLTKAGMARVSAALAKTREGPNDNHGDSDPLRVPAAGRGTLGQTPAHQMASLQGMKIIERPTKGQTI